MYCVIQEVRRKKPDLYGEHKEIIPYPLEMSINGVEQVPSWSWKWSEERYERPRLEAYKISIHHSYREGGVVKKRQYSVCTMSYYDICESWWGDCIIGGENALAEKVGLDAAELYEIIETKLGPLRERLEAEFHQSAEYIAKQEHERIIADYQTAKSQFRRKYDVDGDEYDRCYDVFGVLRNKEYLAEIKAAHKAKRSYRESWHSTYEKYTRGSYSIPSVSTYSEAETAILRKFYKSLSKTYHPDLNPGRDTTAAGTRATEQSRKFHGLTATRPEPRRAGGACSPTGVIALPCRWTVTSARNMARRRSGRLWRYGIQRRDGARPWSCSRKKTGLAAVRPFSSAPPAAGGCGTCTRPEPLSSAASAPG